MIEIGCGEAASGIQRLRVGYQITRHTIPETSDGVQDSRLLVLDPIAGVTQTLHNIVVSFIGMNSCHKYALWRFS